MLGKPCILSLFPNSFNKFNNAVKHVLSGHSKRIKIGFQDRLSLNPLLPPPPPPPPHTHTQFPQHVHTCICRLNLACSATETSLSIWHVESLTVILSRHRISKARIRLICTFVVHMQQNQVFFR